MINYLGQPTKEQKKIVDEITKKLSKNKKYIINFTDDFSKNYKGEPVSQSADRIDKYKKIKEKGIVGGSSGQVGDVYEIQLNPKLDANNLKEILAHELGHSLFKNTPDNLFTTNRTSGNYFNFQEMGKNVIDKNETFADHFADYLLNNKNYSQSYPDENKFFNKIITNNMPRYINTAKNEFYDLTDPNAPKLLGNMTDYARTLAEQNFAGYKAGFTNPADAENERNWFIQRESGKIYQDLLGQTEFREGLAPTAPAPESPYRPSAGFGGPPIQTADQTVFNQPATTERPADPTFQAALAGKTEFVAPTIQTAPKISAQNKTVGGDLILPGGQRISGNDPNYVKYGEQLGVLRKLDLKEFKNLNKEWGQAGLTTQETLDNFLVKKDGNYYLKTDAPSSEQVIANRKSKAEQGQKVITQGQSVDMILDSLKAEFETEISDEKSAANLANQEALKIKAELDAMKAKIDWDKITDIQKSAAIKQGFYDEKTKLEADPNISMEFLNRKLSDMMSDVSETFDKMSIKNSVDDAMAVYKYNTKLIEYNLAQGKAELAQRQTEEAADNFWKFQNLRLDYLQRQDQIDARKADDLRQEAVNENAMAKEGYMYISPNSLQNMITQYGQSKIYTNPVNSKSYLKPDPLAKVKNKPLSISEIESLNSQGYNIPVGATLGEVMKMKISPRKVSGGGGRTPKPTDNNEISDFDYAKQIIEANPNIGDAELKTELLNLVNKKEIKLSVTDINSLIAERKEKKEIETEANKPQSFSQDWFKTKIETARSNDFSDTEIVDYIIKNFDINELFKTAKEAGFAKWYTGKETDIKRYIESLL